MSAVVLETYQDVLRYWFGDDFDNRVAMNSVGYINDRFPYWFARKDPDFDKVQLAHAFLLDDLQIGSDRLEAWESCIEGLLAKVIVLDQFSRSIYRGTARAFAYDQLAIVTARKMVSTPEFLADYNDKLAAVQRLFVIVAIQHSESLEDQVLGVSLAKIIAEHENSKDLVNLFKNLKGFPMEHHDVIVQFGRFPSRNGALGRASTEEETAWLESPDCPAWAKSQAKATQQAMEQASEAK
jgi:uncharacterized protein (DUF924 family)